MPELEKINDRLRNLEIKSERLISHFESEFGNGSTKGNFSRQLDEIREKVKELNDLIKMQNGRVTKLEHRSTFQNGALWVIGILGPFFGGICVWVINNIKNFKWH